jgi:hypothetical protein
VARWYFSTNGKAEGPVTSEFLIDQLKAGKFTLVDLVFREGEAAWKTFGEVPEFRVAYQAPPAFVPPPPPPLHVSPAQAGGETAEIDFDEISIDDFTPTPILNQAQPEPVPISVSPIVLPESTSVKNFEKPEEGWPSDWRLSSSWVILKKRPDGMGYDQDGPFSAEYIIEMIGTGKIEYSQYCWKPGYSRWFRIGNLPEFDRRKRDRDNDTVNQIIPVPAIEEALPALTREELLANVERMRHDQRKTEKAPAGTTGKDLLERTRIEQPVLEPVILADAVRDDFDRSAIAPTRFSEPEPSWKTNTHKVEAKVSPNIFRFGLAAIVAAVVVFAMLQAASMKSRQPASQPATGVPSETSKNRKPVNARPKTSMNETETETVVGTTEPSAPTAAAEPPRLATSLEISPKNLETAPVLEFQSDMGPLDKITVKMKAHTGDIIKFASFAKTYEVAKGGGATVLDLSKEDLPAGTYFVEASVGSAQSSTQIFIGKKDDVFLADLERHIKSVSLRQQSEKTALYYGSQALEKLSKDLITQSQALKAQPLKWKKTLGSWRRTAHDASLPVMTLAQSPANEMVYPEALNAFQAAAERLANQAKEIDAAMAQKRDVASTSIDELTAEFGKLREESAKLTGRPQASN